MLLTKEQFIYTIDAIDDQENRTQNLHEAFKVIDGENTVFSLVAYPYYKAFHDLFKTAIGEDAYETVMWWMYECSRVGKIWFPGSSTHGYPDVIITSAGELYDYLIKNNI